MRWRRVFVAAGTFLACTPAVACANAGTPLMWAGMLHLVVGNAIIGAVEGWLLARVYGVPRRRAVGLMMLANYLSAWAGMLLVESRLPQQAVQIDLYTVRAFLWAMIAATFVMTLVIE